MKFRLNFSTILVLLHSYCVHLSDICSINISYTPRSTVIMLVRIPKKKKTHSGRWDPRVQREMMSVMLENEFRFSSFTKLANWINDEYKMCPEAKTLAEWHRHYNLHHECPYGTAKFYDSLKKRKSYKESVFEFTRKWNKTTVSALREITNRHPTYYLDRFIEENFIKTGVPFHPSTVHYV